MNADLETYRTLGGWVEQPVDLRSPLSANVRADVVVIGGGFAGLSAALELRAAGADVVLLEREFCGFGASGRNAGYLAGAIALEYDLFLKRAGEEKGRQIVRYYDEAVRYAEGKFEEYGIDCDYVQSGIIRAGIHPSQEATVRKGIEVGLRLGHKAQFLDEAVMRARGIPSAFLFGEFDAAGGTLHPGKYVFGLRRAAIDKGVRIFEATPMVSWSDDREITVRAPYGSVTAPLLVVATNAYTPGNGLLQKKIIPIRVSAIETVPLTSAQLAALGWPKREGIITAHHMMESHRLTSDNTLLVTTKRVRYPFGSRTPNIPDRDAYRALRRALKDRFPELRDLPLRACWSGYISMATDALPAIGRTGAHGNILYTAGCSGHGVASQSLVGRLLAQHVRGVTDPILAGIAHDTPTIMPEPLRWCIINGALAVADMVDDRLNAKAASRRG